MSSINYNAGYKYTKSITVPVTITYTRPMFQPTVTGPTTVKTDDPQIYFTIDLTNSTPDLPNGVVVTGAQYQYMANSGRLSIWNITGPVTINITAHGVPLILYVGGSRGGETSQTWGASVPGGGTIKYTDIYGESKTVYVADFGLYATWNSGNKLGAYVEDVLKGSKVICSGISLKYYGTASSGATLRFKNNTTISTWDYSVYLMPGNSASYTWNSVIEGSESQTADIILRSTW